MADKTGIQWTDATWNPVVGCSIISPGCTNCYAMKLAGRLERMGSPIYKGHTQQTKAGPVWNGEVSRSNWGQVIKPLSWRRPRRIFVNSMSDLFHEGLDDLEVDIVFAVMAACSQHQFQALTKRAGRMRAYIAKLTRNPDRLEKAARELGRTLKFEGKWLIDWPLPNVWLGVSVEDQEHADKRIPDLIETPAEVRFLSCEPLLGPVSLHDWIYPEFSHPPQIDWVIAGGESGRQARPMNPSWPRSLRDQCSAAGVPFFFKQHGDWLATADDTGQISYGRHEKHGWDIGRPNEAWAYRVGKRAAGRELDGRLHDAFPAQVAQ